MRTRIDYVDCTELLDGYHDEDYEPYGLDISVAARDCAELRLQSHGQSLPDKDPVVEALALARLVGC